MTTRFWDYLVDVFATRGKGSGTGLRGVIGRLRGRVPVRARKVRGRPARLERRRR